MKYEIDFPAIKFDENFIRKLDLPTVFKQEMLTTATRIKQETQAGRTAEGGALRGYSEGYKRWRARRGLSSHTNLTVTGELARSMVVNQVGPEEVDIAFQGQHAPSSRRTVARSAKSKARNVRPKRGGASLSNAALAQSLYAKGFTGWFTYARKDIDRIKAAVLKKINSELKNLIKVQPPA